MEYTAYTTWPMMQLAFDRLMYVLC